MSRFKSIARVSADRAALPGESTLDRICRQNTAFKTFDELLNTNASYRPTIFVNDSADLMELADAFDTAMRIRGSERRAYRAGKPKKTRKPKPNVERLNAMMGEEMDAAVNRARHATITACSVTPDFDADGKLTPTSPCMTKWTSRRARSSRTRRACSRSAN